MAKRKNKDKTNRNASASIFGWDFQTNAAILLMLDNIKRADSVKVESKTEDIEIRLTDGNIIFSQAKSILNADDTVNLSKKLKDAIKTLNDANKEENVEKLIYITNHSNPLCVRRLLVILVQRPKSHIGIYQKSAEKK